MASSRYYLDAVITMIDAKHVMRHLEPAGALAFSRRRPEAEKQLARADRVILNKVGPRSVTLRLLCSYYAGLLNTMDLKHNS